MVFTREQHVSLFFVVFLMMIVAIQTVYVSTSNFLVQADTSRVIWSWSSVDPSSPSDITQHKNQGTTSLNLLGGLNEPREDRSGAASFVIRNENVSIFEHGLQSHG